MKDRAADVDAYIGNAPEFARPILSAIREAFHAGCPELEERIKWGVPSFEFKGMLGGMAAFKNHVAFGFWKARLLDDFHAIASGAPRASLFGARVAKRSDLPPRKVLVALVREAARLNEEGIKEPKLSRARTAKAVVVPPDLKAALARNARAKAAFAGFPPSARRDYVEWIVEAKRDETRIRRVATAIEWLSKGKRRNWKYEKTS